MENRGSGDQARGKGGRCRRCHGGFMAGRLHVVSKTEKQFLDDVVFAA